MFERYVGIDYSGAATPRSPLPGLRVYVADGPGPPAEVRPHSDARRHWTRRGVAEWLRVRLERGPPALVGIDHGFSFPLAYFEQHGLERAWPAFLDDLHTHWPVDGDDVRVDDVRRGRVGSGAARRGDACWRRLTEHRAGGAKSVFHFDVPGSVAKSTIAGLPWIRRLRRHLGPRMHVWPFDGWSLPPGRSVMAEVFPTRWRDRHPRHGRGDDQHDAFVAAAWLRDADRTGRLDDALRPALTDSERSVAGVEGWILGVP